MVLNLFKLTNKIYEQSDEIFFIDKSDLKDDWSIQHLTPSSIAMINQLSHKMLLCDISNIIPGNLILKTNNSIDGIPYIRISDITNGVLDVNNSIRINATHANQTMLQLFMLMMFYYLDKELLERHVSYQNISMVVTLVHN